jgi:multiple sugar transport system ATP-binding protein
VLAARSLSKRFRGAEQPALDGVSFSIEGARTLSVVGPSGAGKSTLLRILAGLERADTGDVELDGALVTTLEPQARRIAMVFQDAALVPQMSVAANLQFALRERGDTARVDEIARALHLENCLPRRPRELSGGERQRAAIGRAHLSDPLALLLDEPLAHVDPFLRARIRDDVVRVRERFAGPIVYVTHDHAEAMAVGDVLAVIVRGRIEQIGDPQRVYDVPANLRVARFLGVPAMNLLTGVGTMLGNERAIVGVRCENVSICTDGPLQGRVVRCEQTGADTYVYVTTSHGDVVVRTPSRVTYDGGAPVRLRFSREVAHCYDPDTEELIA